MRKKLAFFNLILIAFFVFLFNMNAKAATGYSITFRVDGAIFYFNQDVVSGNHTLYEVAPDIIDYFGDDMTYNTLDSNYNVLESVDPKNTSLDFVNNYSIEIGIDVKHVDVDNTRYYYLINGTNVKLISVTGAGSSIYENVVPDTLEIEGTTYNVTEISKYYSTMYDGLSELYLTGANLTTVEAGAFVNWKTLNFLQIKNGLSIPDDSFDISEEVAYRQIDVVYGSNLDLEDMGIELRKVRTVYYLGDSLTLSDSGIIIYYYKENATENDIGYFTFDDDNSIVKGEIYEFTQEPMNCAHLYSASETPSVYISDPRTGVLKEGVDYSLTITEDDDYYYVKINNLTRYYAPATLTITKEAGIIDLSSYGLRQNKVFEYTGEEISLDDYFASLKAAYPSLDITYEKQTNNSSDAYTYTITSEGTTFYLLNEAEYNFDSGESTIVGYYYISKTITQDDLGNDLKIEGLDEENLDYSLGVNREVDWSTLNEVTYKNNPLTHGTDFDYSLKVLDDDGNVYELSGGRPGLSVYDENGTVYTVLYTFTFKGAYSGKITYERKLCPSIEGATIMLEGQTDPAVFPTYAYTGEQIIPDITSVKLQVNGQWIELTKDVDYEIQLSDGQNYIDASDMSKMFYITGIGNYAGSYYANFYIKYEIKKSDVGTKLIIGGVDITNNDNYTIGVATPYDAQTVASYITVEYNGEAITEPDYSCEISLLDADDNECRYDSDTFGLTSDMANGDVYRIVYNFEFANGEYFGKFSLEQKLCPDIQDHLEITFKNNTSTYDGKPVYAYTGETLYPSFDKVVFVNGDTRKELVLDQDFEFAPDSASTYTNVSEYVYEIHLKGIGDYGGTNYVQYYIFAEIKDSDLNDKLIIEGLPTQDLEYVLNEGREIIYDFSGKVSYNNLTLETDVNYSWEVKVLDSDNQEHYYDASNTPGIIGDDCNFDVYRVQFVFTFSGGYTGTVTHEINLCPSIETADFTFSGNHSSYDGAPTYIYTGKKIIPTFDTFTLSHNGVTKTLVKDTDYKIIEDSDTNYINIDPHKKYVIVKGIGNYAGSNEIGFYISKYKIEDLTILYSDKYPFDQAPSTNDVKIIADGFELLNVDNQYYGIYVIPNADQIKLQIQGLGFVSGVKEFDITLAEENEDLVTLTSNDISLEDDPLVAEYNSDLSVIKYNFTGEEITPTLTIRHEGATLVEGTDYEVVAYNNINPGTYNGHSVEARPMNIFITGKGNYHGIVNLNAHINMDEIDLSDVSFDYNGKNIDVTTYTSSSIKSISCETDVLNAGTYDMLITANPGYGFKVDDEYVTSATKEITVNAFIYPNPELEIEVTPTYDKASYGLKSDGSAVEPLISEINFKGEGVDITLTEGTDFKITSYEDNTEAGTGKIHVNILTSNISLAEIETLDLEFEIKGKDISDYISANNIAFDYQDDDNYYFLYTGSSIQPIVTVDGLILDTDYEVDYNDNLDEEGTIYIRGLGEYGGEFEISFIIRENILLSSNTTIEFVDKLEDYDDPTYISTGEQLKPTIKVLYNREEIDSSNYNIIYGDNVLSSGVIGIEGKNDFIGSIETEFTILNYDINDAEFEIRGFDSVEDGVYIYQFNGESPDLYIETITYNGLTFEEGIEIVEFDISDPGTYTLRLYGVGEFYGEKTISCKTNAILVKDLKIEYTNSIITFEELLTANSLADCGTVTSIDEAKNVGTYNISFELNKGYAIFDETEEAYLTEAIVTFEVIAKKLTKDDLTIDLDEYYLTTGEAVEPEFSLKYGDLALVLDTDYEVEYSNNITAGDGLITITLINNYSNEDDIKFEFSLINYDINEAEIVFDGFDEIIDGTYIYYFDGQNPEISISTITYDGQVFEEGAEIVEYNIKTPKAYTLTIKGVGAFYGQTTVACETKVTLVKDLKIEYKDSIITSEELLDVNSLADCGVVTSIDEAKNAGTYNISFELTKGYALFIDEEYVTTGSTTFEVYAKELTKDDLTINLDDYYLATGEEINPEFNLKYGELELVLDSDYEVNYSNNINAGKGLITITLLNNYSNDEDIKYEFIIYYDFEEAEITLEGFDNYTENTYVYEFDGTNPTITAKVTYNDVEYENSCSILTYDISKPGRHTLTLQGINDFYGEQEIDCETVYLQIKNLKIEYTNSNITFDELLEANYLEDAATLVSIDEAKNVGTYNVSMKLNRGYALLDDDNNYLTEGTTTFEVIAKKLTKDDLTIELEDSYYTTGEELTPEFVLKYGNVELALSTDFEATYSNNINAGKGQIAISLLNNYSNEEDIIFEFSIYNNFEDAILDINGFDDIIDGVYIYQFDGTNPEITVSTITFNEIGYEAMCEIEDYDITNPGTYTITINGNGDFLGSQIIDVKTTVILLDDLEIEFNNNDISFNDVMEANDIVDYGQSSVVEEEAINVGTYHANVYLNKGYAIYQDGSYLTTGITTFKIIPRLLTKEDLSINFFMADTAIPTYYATGNEIKPEFSLYYGNFELDSDDFEISYSNNVLPGTATLTISLINNYTNEDEISYEFKIMAKVMYESETSYTGKVIYMMDVLKQNGLDQAIEKIKNGDYSARYAGTYKCYVVLKEGFSFDEEGLITEGEYSWTILPFEINLEDVVVEISKQAYTGQAITPAINISYNGREIRVEDYDLTLENNIEIGTATATIKVKNNFIAEGEIVKEFEIFDPDKPFKDYRARVVKSLDSYLADGAAANLATNIGKLATADGIKSLYLATMPTILANKLLSIGGYITSIKDIDETNYDGLNAILELYNDLENYVIDNKYTSTINSVLEEDLLTDEVLTNDIKAVLDLLVSDLGYSKFASFVEDLINASIIEKEKSEALDSVQKTIRTHDKVSVLSVMEHQKEELKAQEYIIQTDDDERNNYLENFKEEVYRQRVLYQIQLQHQIAQSRSINSVTDIYNNLINEHTYNELELIKLKDILDDYIVSINELEMCQTEEEEVKLIYQMANMAETAIYALYDVGVANIVSDEVIISSSTGINKDAVVKVEVNKNITSSDIINAKNNGIISSINKTDEELEELVSNKEVLRVMDISIVAKDEVVDNFDGIYTVKIPLDNDLKNVNNPVVVFINADGTLEVLDTYVEGEFLVFKTTHFSNYAVIGNKIVDLGWLLILLLLTFVVEVFIVVYLIKLTKPFKSKKALGLLTILPTGFVGYLVTLIILNIIGIAAIVYLIVRFNKSCDKEVDKNE